MIAHSALLSARIFGRSEDNVFLDNDKANDNYYQLNC